MSLAEFSVRRRVTVFMVTLTFVLFGLIGLGALPVNLLPLGVVRVRTTGPTTPWSARTSSTA